MNGEDVPRGSVRTGSFDVAVAGALDAQSDIRAIASLDVRTGEVIQATVRGDTSRDLLGFAALAASSVCSGPRFDACDDSEWRDALIVSESAIHAFAPTRGRPGRIVVGIAGGGANVALLVAAVRRVAEAIAG